MHSTAIHLKPASNYELRQLQIELYEIRKPYIQLLVDLYAKALPAITTVNGQVAELNYPEWIQEQAREIRELMETAQEPILAAYKRTE